MEVSLRKKIKGLKDIFKRREYHNYKFSYKFLIGFSMKNFHFVEGKKKFKKNFRGLFHFSLKYKKRQILASAFKLLYFLVN